MDNKLWQIMKNKPMEDRGLDNESVEDNLQESLLQMGYDEMPVSDVVHLKYPVSRENIIPCFDMRFIRGLLETWLGPSLIIINSYTNNTKLSLDINQEENNYRLLKHKVIEILHELFETKQPQTLLFSGESGSGKSYNARQALYYLFCQTNYGLASSSCFPKVSAALTVLRAMVTVSTVCNSSSSRVGLFIQNYIRDYSIYKTKINCVYIDHARLTEVDKHFNNYHIFYQMLAGLTAEEKSNLYLDNFSDARDFHYLSMGSPPADPDTLKEQFEEWKTCLSTCDVSFRDVTRILAAVLLIGNITFVCSNGLELDVKGQNELKAVAALLGVSSMTLYQGLTTRTVMTQGRLTVTPVSNASRVHASRDALSQALYIRTVHTIVRKANSLLRAQNIKKGRNPSNASGSCKSDDRLSLRKSFHSLTSDRSIPTSSERPAATLVNIMDMFGFEQLKNNRLEQLAINLCSETMQSYYNSHILHSPKTNLRQQNLNGGSEAMNRRENNASNVDEIDREDGVWQESYFDNRPIIDLISHPVNGIFTFLHDTVRECRNPAESLVHRIETAHSRNSFLNVNGTPPCVKFTIHHSAGSIAYNATTFMDRNKDTIPDDIVWVFSQDNCVFGFGTHLFYQEIGDASVPGPQGKLYKVLPRIGFGRMSSHTNSLTEDFCLKLEEILKKIALTKPHFVHCIKSNDSSSYLTFKTDVIRRQLDTMQIVETVNLMKTTPIHRLKYSFFNSRYQLLLPKMPSPLAGNPVTICEDILEHLKEISRNFSLDSQSFNWVFRQKHLLFSELIRQELEAYKLHILYQSAVIIQTQWRGYQCRKRWPFLFQHLQALQLRRLNSMPNEYNPVFVTSSVSRLDWKTVQQICSTYGIDPTCTPPVPAPRHYSVAGNMKVDFPQTRIATQLYKIAKRDWLLEGDEVRVLRPSSTKVGYLTVQSQGITHDVPHYIVQLRTMGTLL